MPLAILSLMSRDADHSRRPQGIFRPLPALPCRVVLVVLYLCFMDIYLPQVTVFAENIEPALFRALGFYDLPLKHSLISLGKSESADTSQQQEETETAHSCLDAG